MDDLELFHDVCYDTMNAAVDAIMAGSPLEVSITCRSAMTQKGVTDITKPTPYEAGAIDTVRIILLDHIDTFFGEELSGEQYAAAKKHVEAFIVACERLIAALWRKNGEPLQKKVYTMTLYGKTFEYRDLPAFPNIDAHLSAMYEAMGIGTDDDEDKDEDEDEDEDEGFVQTAEQESGVIETVRREIGARIYRAAYLRSAN